MFPADISSGTFPADTIFGAILPAHADHGGELDALATGHLDLVAFLVIGLLAGAHCLGMCGPLVTAYADRMSRDGHGETGRRSDDLTLFEVRQHTLFNLGRTASYAFLGGLFGLLGLLAFASADLVANVGDGVRGVLGIVVGALILFAGIGYLAGGVGTLDPGRVPLLDGLFQRLSGTLVSRIDRLASSPGIVGLGALHGLLPCPIIYPAYLYALALGDPVRGALSLGLLGLGTIPVLFAYGTLLGSIGLTGRRRLHRVLGVAFVVLGYVPLQHGLMLYGIHLPHPPLPFYQPLL